MPLVIFVAKSEAIKEETDTWYISVDDIPRTNDSKTFLSSLSKKVRRDVKKKLKIFNERNLRVTTEHSDWLSLRKDMPVLIDHERRVVEDVGKGIFIEEFIKRFLVIFLGTNGCIDRYYKSNDGVKPVALCWFVEQGEVLHTFMYFCKSDEKLSGIWCFQHISMMVRLVRSSCEDVPNNSSTENSQPLLDQRRLKYAKYVNFHTHQDFAKKCIGAKNAPFTANELMADLYPLKFFRTPSKVVRDTVFCTEAQS